MNAPTVKRLCYHAPRLPSAVRAGCTENPFNRAGGKLENFARIVVAPAALSFVRRPGKFPREKGFSRGTHASRGEFFEVPRSIKKKTGGEDMQPIRAYNACRGYVAYNAIMLDVNGRWHTSRRGASLNLASLLSRTVLRSSRITARSL